MRNRRPLLTHDLWLPIIVGSVSSLVVLAVWGILIADRRARLVASTTEIAAATREAVSDSLRRDYSELRGLARDASREWNGSRDATLPPSIARRAGQLIELREGFERISWVDLERPGSGLQLAGPNAGAKSKIVDPATRELDSSQERLIGPYRDADGELIYQIHLPILAKGETTARALLTARILLEDQLADLFRARAPGFALEVRWDETLVYSRGEPSRDAWQNWWSVEEPIELPLGQTLRVTYRPTPEYAAARLNAVPHYLLFVGLVLSISLAFLSYQLRVTIRQSRSLEKSNRDLEQRGNKLALLNTELEDRVTERTEALEEAVDELKAFNYSVSHDLRSPLGAILNFAAIIEEDYRTQPLGEDGVALVGRIKRSATRAIGLLEDLLQLSRAGRIDLRRERLDMRSLARHAFSQALAAEGSDDVELTIAPLPDVDGDPDLIGDVFVNLFTNALKYSRDREKRRISVTGRFENGEAIYEVADNGRGFDMRFAPKLFQVFERLHNDDDIEGTGVGLAIVARIVKRHGGRVWGFGELGRGARFSFSLPEHPGVDR